MNYLEKNFAKAAASFSIAIAAVIVGVAIGLLNEGQADSFRVERIFFCSWILLGPVLCVGLVQLGLSLLFRSANISIVIAIVLAPVQFLMGYFVVEMSLF